MKNFRNFAKISSTAKLKNRRVTLFLRRDGAYAISTRALAKDYEGRVFISKDSLVLSAEAMLEVVKMWHGIEHAERREHRFICDSCEFEVGSSPSQAIG